jgi:putative ABC transport system permease protein
MATLRKVKTRARILLGRRSFEHDLDDEMRFHLEMETEKNIERGFSPEEARAMAEREFGRVDRFKDEVRDVRGATFLDDTARDVRFALRSLLRSPAFTAVAVLCLALGIGANAALFSVLNAVLLRPLPYAEPDRVVRIYETTETMRHGSASMPNFKDWAAQGTGFARLAAYERRNLNLLGSSEPERVTAVLATPELFTVLGTRPLLGRTFIPGQDDPDREKIVVISEGLWRSRFGADRSLVGREIQLDGAAHTVVGVMPAGFQFPPGRNGADVWTLYTPPFPEAAENRGTHMLAVVGRIKDGVTLEAATAQLVEVAARIEKEYPDAQTGRSVAVASLRESLVGDSRRALLILFGAVALVLLIACANVANLLLARAAVREREVAIRLALGASRARLVRQFLVESLVLAFAGAALGTLLAMWGLQALGPLAQSALPVSGSFSLDGRVFGFLLSVALLSGLAFGLVPALQASRGNVQDTLIGGGSGKATSSGRQQRFRSGLVVLEIALSLVLLIGAGLLLRGFLRLSSKPPGLVAENVLTAHVSVPADRLPASTTQVFRPLLEKVRAIPGVEAAGLISMLPIQDAWMNGSFTVEGRPAPPPGQDVWAEIRVASPGFFKSLGIPILRGRDFEEADGESGPLVTVVNDALVRKTFPNEDPIGKEINFGGGTVLTIVGVVGDVRQAGLDQEPLMEIYMPYGYPEYTIALGDASLVVKTTVTPESVTGPIREAVRSIDSSLPIYQVLTMEEVISESLAERRLQLWLLGLFAGMALVLSAAGLYGVISYLVAQRTREIGVRIALGAQVRDVIGLVMRQGVRLTGLGLAAGLLAALAFTRFLQSLLYEVSARDPLTYAAIAGLLALVALFATFIPARRAAHVNPMVTIRTE